MKRNKIATNEAYKDLFELESIKVEEKRLNKNAEESVIEWVTQTVEDIEALWEVPISKADSTLGFGVAIKHIQNAVGISYSVAHRHRALTNPLIEKMIEEGILVIPDENYEAASIENSRKLLNWYRQLSEEEKYALPIFGNKVSIKKISSQQLPIKRNSLRFKVVKDPCE